MKTYKEETVKKINNLKAGETLNLGKVRIKCISYHNDNYRNIVSYIGCDNCYFYGAPPICTANLIRCIHSVRYIHQNKFEYTWESVKFIKI